MSAEHGDLVRYRMSFPKDGFLENAEEDARSARKVIEDQISGFNKLGQLKSLKESLFDESKNPRVLSAVWVSQTAVSITLRMALRSADTGNIPNFIVWHDLSHGAGQVVGILQMNDSHTKDGERQSLSVTESAIHGSNANLEHEINTFLFLERIRAASKEVIDDDSTGFKLVDEIVKLTSNEPNRLLSTQYDSICNPVIERQGVDIAAKPFKGIYPVAKQVIRAI